MLNDKTILITGGTGSFGKNALKLFLKNTNPKNLLSSVVMNLSNFKWLKSFPKGFHRKTKRKV